MSCQLAKSAVFSKTFSENRKAGSIQLTSVNFGFSSLIMRLQTKSLEYKLCCKKGTLFMAFKLNYLFSYLVFHFRGFDLIFSLVLLLLEVSEDLWICAIDTVFQQKRTN